MSKSNLSPQQLTGLSNLATTITQRITCTNEGRFIIPQDLLDNLSDFLSQPSSIPQDEDVLNIARPRRALSIFANTINLERDLTIGDIRQAYLHIFRNGSDINGRPIPQNIITGFEQWINNNAANDQRPGMPKNFFGTVARAIESTNTNRFDAIAELATNQELAASAQSTSTHDALHVFNAAQDHIIPKMYLNITVHRNSDSYNPPVISTKFLTDLNKMINGRYQGGNADIDLILGQERVSENFLTMMAMAKPDSKPQDILKEVRNTYLKGLREGVDESNRKIGKEVISNFVNWMVTEQRKLIASSNSAGAGASSSSSSSLSSSSGSSSSSQNNPSETAATPSVPSTTTTPLPQSGASTQQQRQQRQQGQNPYQNAFTKNTDPRSKK